MKKNLIICLSVVLLCCLVFMGQAYAALYGIEAGSPGQDLLSINETSGAGTVIGPLGNPPAASTFGLGVTDGRMFTYDQGYQVFHELNIDTGAVINTFDLNIKLEGEGSLAFRSDGVGFITGGIPQDASFDSRLYQFNIMTMTSSLVATLTDFAIDGLAFDANDTLYALTQGFGSSGWTTQKLYTLNQTSGAASFIGDTGVGLSTVGGLAIDGGQFYSTDGYSLFQLNSTTGAASLIGGIGYVVNDITAVGGTTQVPEPATLLLLGSGAMGLALARKRFKG